MNTFSKVSSFIFILLFSFTAKSQCDSQSVKTPGTASSSAFSGSSFQFLNPLNILPASNSFASATALLTLLNGKSELLEARNFGFNLPPNAIICGIEAQIRQSAEGINILSVVTDDKVQLLNNGVTVGANLGKPDWWGFTALTKSYGGNTSLWGRVWTPAEINSANFGVGLSVQINGLLALLPTAKIHGMQVTVHYSLANILPLTIKDFTVRAANSSTYLEWALLDIEPNTKQILERSIDGVNWNAIYSSEALAISQSAAGSFVDQSPVSGQNYYRLKIISNNTHSLFSKVLKFLNNSTRGKLVVYPNPATGQIIVSEKDLTQLRIFNAFGKQVLQKKNIIDGHTQLDIRALPVGMYILKTAEGAVKFVKE